MDYVKTALSHMVAAHKGQTDKSGKPYYHHPARVREAVREHGPEYEATALLHDVVEDTPTTIQDLRDMGMPESVVIAVDHLTRRDGEAYMDFIRRAAKDPIALVVKMADISDNMRPGAPESLYARYRKAMGYLKSQSAIAWREPSETDTGRLIDAIEAEIHRLAWKANEDSAFANELNKSNKMIRLAEVRAQIMVDFTQEHSLDHWLKELNDLGFEPDINEKP